MSKDTDNIRSKENFYKLLRLSLRLTQEFPDDINNEEWRRLYQTAARQTLTGVCYEGVRLLTHECKPPMEIAMQWATDAEGIKGMNELQYQEAARLTSIFAEKGRRTVILKGQANAMLYPNQYSRQPGDIDIWVEGGRESVLALLPYHPMTSYHHAHLPPNEQGISVEVHYRPSSGNYSPITNKRLQRWLEKEILKASIVEERGFYVPPMRFALVMQMAHIQRHFLSSGIGLRHVCDYYWLLQEASDEDRREVVRLMGRFGLRHTAKALMWVLDKVLHLDKTKMIGSPDSRNGERMLREIMAGGNFGWYHRKRTTGIWEGFFQSRLHRLRMIPFNCSEVLWMEIDYWKSVFKTLPQRIRYRSLSLRNIPR